MTTKKKNKRKKKNRVQSSVTVDNHVSTQKVTDEYLSPDFKKKMKEKTNVPTRLDILFGNIKTSLKERDIYGITLDELYSENNDFKIQEVTRACKQLYKEG